jgi:hypothetical protein
MLTVFTLFIRSKNPVIANFTVAKRKRQDVQKIVVFCFYQEYTLCEKLPG